MMTAAFSTAQFQSEPTVTSNHVETNRREYLNDYASGLMAFLECEQTSITKFQRENVLYELNNIIKELKK